MIFTYQKKKKEMIFRKEKIFRALGQSEAIIDVWLLKIVWVQ